MPYWYFLIPLFSGFTTQVCKWILSSLKEGQFCIQLFSSYGGMPSAHAAVISSLLVLVGNKDGLQSTTFIITAGIGFIIIHDALGLRRQLEKHFHHRFGHTIPEIGVGATIGMLITSILLFFTQ